VSLDRNDVQRPFYIGIIQDHATTTSRELWRVPSASYAPRRSARPDHLPEGTLQLRSILQGPAVRRFDLAEPFGPTTDRMQADPRASCRSSSSSRCSSGRQQGIYRNSAAVIDADGALLGVYRKMHIPDDPSFYEKYYFTPGDGHLDYHGEQPAKPTASRCGRHVTRRSAY
jgi:N-carbamoylputrescine amidase